jgi:hypothetical protein
MLEHCERERYSEIVVSTPGPIGLAGVAAGKLLGIRLAGIYRAHLPRYVRNLAGGPALEELTWAYLRWFFGQLDRVYVARRDRDPLVARGFDPSRLRGPAAARSGGKPPAGAEDAMAG